MKHKFKLWVITPKEERLYFMSCTKMETLKKLLDTARGKLYYGYSIEVQGPANKMVFNCFAPMTDAAIMRSHDFIPALKKRMMGDFKKAPPVLAGEVLPPEPPSLKERFRQQLADFNKAVTQLCLPAPREMSRDLFKPRGEELPNARRDLLQKQIEMFPQARAVIAPAVLEHYDTGPVKFPTMGPVM